MRAEEKRGFTIPKSRWKVAKIHKQRSRRNTEASRFTHHQRHARVSAAVRQNWREQAVTTFAMSGNPVRRALKFMRNGIRSGLTYDAVGKRPAGWCQFYRAKIREVSPHSTWIGYIHSLGEAEVAKLHGEMLAG